jgi:hypothetical protein
MRLTGVQLATMHGSDVVTCADERGSIVTDSLERKYLDRDGKYRAAAKTFRIVGPVLLVVGGLCIVSGMVGLISVGPVMILLFILGGPVLMVGFLLTALGFMGTVARYQAEQVAPVGKDVVNYMAVGTQQGVKTASKAMAEGLREGLAGQPLINVGAADPPPGASIACPKCHAANQAGSKFCDQCGAALMVACDACGAANQAGSKFCDQCGKPLAGSPS